MEQQQDHAHARQEESDPTSPGEAGRLSLHRALKPLHCAYGLRSEASGHFATISLFIFLPFGSYLFTTQKSIFNFFQKALDKPSAV